MCPEAPNGWICTKFGLGGPLTDVINLSWGDSRPYAVLQRTLDKDCRQAEEPNRNLLMKLAGSTWGTSTNTLRSSALALCYSAAEYCAPVWSCSAHTSQVDVQLNSTMHLISDTLHSTPLPWLPVLSTVNWHGGSDCRFQIASDLSK